MQFLAVALLCLFTSPQLEAAPQIFLKKGDLLDMQLSMFGAPKIETEVKNELDSRIGEFQASWDTAAQEGILEISEKMAGKKFDRSEYTCWLSLAPLIPMGRPLIMNMNPYLESAVKNHPTLPAAAFVMLNHHEVLHFLVEDIEGEVLFQMSKLAQKYGSESLNVLEHLHLMAIQKATYEKMGKIGRDLLIQADFGYTKIIEGEYLRAWEIVEKEGTRAFLDELQAFNGKY